ncbi:hypothetical protein MHU86_17696 [Fragilaria crotonensis]|nr:hypothetical protein MHU86_17696 [Fragilaria crotonensis]
MGFNKRNIQTSAWHRTAATVCLVATAGTATGARFDSDSVIIHVDNCASRCISNSLADFVKPPQKVIGRIKGMGGDKVAVTGIGMIRWTIDDDMGTAHSFVIPGSLYIPDSPARLFSPQHWAQERKDDYPERNGSWQATFSDHVMLVWGQKKFSKKIPFDKSNVATFTTTPGCKNFRLFRACLEATDDDEINACECVAFDATIIEDDEDDEVTEHQSEYHEDDASIEPVPQTLRQGPSVQIQTAADDQEEQGYTKTTRHHDTSYDAYKNVAVVEDVEEDSFAGKLTATAELLLWHFRLGHVPFSRLVNMAKEGLLPKRLSNCRVPKCSSCIYGKMTRRAKRTKNEKSRIEARVLTGPGSCVSVDQLESRTMGLIGHMKGTPTVLQRYRCATIYIDHYSRLSYVHLQRQLTSEETVQGKVAFEKFCEARGVTVTHYHADNGRFADKGFVNHVTANRQSITYCGVNAHFQNPEKRIRDLQDQVTTMLLHAESKWPDVITANLSPYALREANETLNATPSKVTGKVANQVFSNNDTPTMLRHYHTFGCPVYILDDNLAAGKSIPKWHRRARLGVYLGRSPNHAQSVALVLNLSTGLVSPQFHLKFDDLFETIKDHDTYPNRWKVATHFKKEKGSKTRREVTSVPREETQETTGGGGNDHQQPSNPPNDDTGRQAESQTETGVIKEEPTTIITAQSGRPEESAEEVSVRKWARRHKPTTRLLESQAQARLNDHAAFSATLPSQEARSNQGNDYDADVYHGAEEYEIQRQMADPIAFAASSDPDIMYLHEALKQPDRKHFIQAMVDEVTTHTERGHWKLIPISEVPSGTKILPAVWAIRQKRKILSREVYKWKARLNIHGGKQTYGVDYWETYAAALKWSSIRFFLADVECDLYLEVPQGFEFKGSRKFHCLKLVKNLYGSKAAGRVWQQHLFKGLGELGFVQSGTDECVFYRGTTTFMIYTDDGIFCGPDEAEIAGCLKDLSSRFDITDEGDIDEYLGVKVTREDDGTITLTQPHLIDSIIADLGFRRTRRQRVPQRHQLQASIETSTVKHTTNRGNIDRSLESLTSRSLPGLTSLSQSINAPDTPATRRNVTRQQSDILSGTSWQPGTRDYSPAYRSQL